jgi:hypothetical protein
VVQSTNHSGDGKKISRGDEVKEDFPEAVTFLLALQGEKEVTQVRKKCPCLGEEGNGGRQSLPSAMALFPTHLR